MNNDLYSETTISAVASKKNLKKHTNGDSLTVFINNCSQFRYQLILGDMLYP